VLVSDADTLADECRQRLGDPIRALKMKMHHLKVGGAQQSHELGYISGRPLGARERVDFDAEFFQGIGERTTAVHHRHFDIKGRAIAVPEHVEQRRLRAAQIEMIDDVENANHHESPLRKACTFASLSCHSFTNRAASSCAVESFAGSDRKSIAPVTRPSNSSRAHRPA
jgi:hypothetical protein